LGTEVKTGVLSETAMHAMQEAVRTGLRDTLNGSYSDNLLPLWMFRDVTPVVPGNKKSRVELKITGKFWYPSASKSMCLRADCIVVLLKRRGGAIVRSVVGDVRCAYDSTDVIFTIEK
jgi:hypothetical protein